MTVTHIVHLAIDEVVVGHRWQEILSGRGHDLLNDGVVFIMVVIAEQDRTQINIVLRIVMRTINDHRTEDTVSVLRGVMRVPEAGAVKIRPESVSEGRSGGNRALLDRGNTVEPRRLRLQETVPVQRSALVGQIVVNDDFNPVTPVGFNRWARELSIDDHACPLVPVWCDRLLSKCKIIVACYAGVRYVLVEVGVFGGTATPRFSMRQWRATEERRKVWRFVCTQVALPVRLLL